VSQLARKTHARRISRFRRDHARILRQC
jgi:hypothetical protein